MRFFRSGSPVTKTSADRRIPAAALVEAPNVSAIEEATIEGQTGGGEEGHSDVFVCRRSSPDLAPDGVTLFVYGWENVQPGPLSWVFPTLGTALDAVRTMKNAVEWCIVAGREWSSVDVARARGMLLVEQGL
ncbi:MAG: hypothetical protein JST00_12835 [Deltaproteobacteria bacterium]|nr:hypothetical protein [Deltaproteobacteria bacterium]